MNTDRRTDGGWTTMVAGLIGCVLVACLAAGCTVARSNLGTTDSPCYLALPAATMATGSHGKLIGVRLFRLNNLRQRYPRLYHELPAAGTSRQQVCVLGFSGQFTRASVSRPYGKAAGHLAVVVLDAPSNRLIGTVIFNHQPIPLGHSHIG